MPGSPAAINPAYDIESAAYQKQIAIFDEVYGLPHEYGHDWESSLFGKHISQAQDLIDMINPAAYAKSDNTPLLLLQSGMDSTVNFLHWWS